MWPSSPKALWNGNLLTTDDKPSYKVIGVNGNFLKIEGWASLYITYGHSWPKQKIYGWITEDTSKSEIILPIEYLKLWGFVRGNYLNIDEKRFDAIPYDTSKTHNENMAAVMQALTRIKGGVTKETEAKIVREKLIKEFKDVFKDKLEKDGNINMEEVKLELKDPGRKVPTKFASSAKEIPIH